MSHPPPANDFDGLLSDDEEEPVREEGKHFFWRSAQFITVADTRPAAGPGHADHAP